MTAGLTPELTFVCCRKCKLYRYEASSNEWKERGLGVVKLLKHKENGKIRLLMRQEKTLKIRANHIGAGSGSSAAYGNRQLRKRFGAGH